MDNTGDNRYRWHTCHFNATPLIFEYMKKIFLILLCCGLISCGYEIVEIENPKRPFIVGKIEYVSDSVWVYTSKNWNPRFVTIAAEKARIQAAAGLWQVGDTIRFPAY